MEHPLHFAADAPMKPARATPYGPNRSFPAQALHLYANAVPRRCEWAGCNWNRASI